MAKAKSALRKKQDEAVKNFFTSEVITSADSHDSYAKRVDGYTKRFEAARSIKGLSYGADPDRHPKTEPWKYASDVGVPIEAITIRAIVARFVKTLLTKPICNVQGRGDGAARKEDAKIVQEYNEYTLEDEMEFERQFYDILLDTALAGDGIGKLIEANEEYEWEETYFTIIHPETGEPIPDPDTKNEFDPAYPNGYPIEVDEDFPPPPDVITGVVPEVREITVEKTDKTYFGTKLIPISPKDMMLPERADSWDYDELPWIGHKMRKNWHWLKKRVGDVEDGMYDKEAVENLKPQKEDNRISTVKKINLIELWGRVDMPMDTKGEKTKVREIIALYETEKQELLGWIPNPYKGKRMIFHWQIMPMSHSSRGKGIPEFARGLRELIDSLINNMVDRDTINSHAPFVYDEESGFDPSIHEFGPQEFWGVSDKARLGRLDMGNTAEFTSQWIIEFAMGMLQRLFGVTDYTTGSESKIASNQTARGIQAIIGEGNYSFDTMIKILNMTNRKFFGANIRMHAKMLKESKMEEKVFYVTEEQENPYRKISRSLLAMNWSFIPRGTSVDDNAARRREFATARYDKLATNPLFSPQLSPTTAHNFKVITQDYIEAFELKGVKLPTPEELEEEMIRIKAEIEKKIRKDAQIDQLKKIIKHKKGTPEAEAAKKVLGDIELATPPKPQKGQQR